MAKPKAKPFKPKAKAKVNQPHKKVTKGLSKPQVTKGKSKFNKKKKMLKGPEERVISKTVEIQTAEDLKKKGIVYERANVSMKPNLKENFLYIRVLLHRIPEDYINFEPTATHLYVDTLQFSKKFYFYEPYPLSIETDPNGVEGVLENGVLVCKLPILKYDESILEERKGKKRRNLEENQDSTNKKQKKEGEEEENGAKENGAENGAKRNKRNKKNKTRKERSKLKQREEREKQRQRERERQRRLEQKEREK
eukprot:TRINITY_DN5903_c0_g1_i1.p1 TRINITY_DN5903_c0_g1~~TRINITY_DN5903_c0_g1_i1.p1  ORF type:complete len:271 (+),score=118.07 TRINITY_DN5903_c0_g1_i1:59-814(+)